MKYVKFFTQIFQLQYKSLRIKTPQSNYGTPISYGNKLCVTLYKYLYCYKNFFINYLIFSNVSRELLCVFFM